MPSLSKRQRYQVHRKCAGSDAHWTDLCTSNQWKKMGCWLTICSRSHILPVSWNKDGLLQEKEKRYMNKNNERRKKKVQKDTWWNKLFCCCHAKWLAVQSPCLMFANCLYHGQPASGFWNALRMQRSKSSKEMGLLMPVEWKVCALHES